MRNDLLRQTAAMILALSWIIALHETLYAKELPGEGFTAGVLLLTALLLQFVIQGFVTAARLYPPALFFGLATAGMSIFLLLMLVPLTWGGELLEDFNVRLGGLVLHSVTIFDIALTLTVVGALLSALTSLKEPIP